MGHSSNNPTSLKRLAQCFHFFFFLSFSAGHGRPCGSGFLLRPVVVLLRIYPDTTTMHKYRQPWMLNSSSSFSATHLLPLLFYSFARERERLSTESLYKVRRADDHHSPTTSSVTTTATRRQVFARDNKKHPFFRETFVTTSTAKEVRSPTSVTVMGLLPSLRIVSHTKVFFLFFFRIWTSRLNSIVVWI